MKILSLFREQCTTTVTKSIVALTELWLYCKAQQYLMYKAIKQQYSVVRKFDAKIKFQKT
jgi:hypothetical protein